MLATDGVKLINKTEVGAVQLWDVATGKALDLLVGPSKREGPPDYFGYLAFSPDGQTLAAASFRPDAQMAVLWDVAERKQRVTLEGKSLK